MTTITNKLTLASIAGYKNEKAEAEKIINLFKNYETLKAFGVSIPKGLILSGMPGVGKTLMAKVIASETNVPLYEYELTDDDTPKKCIANIKKLYDEARKNAPSIVFIDELDEIVQSDDYVSDMSRLILKNLLTEIDGIKSSDGVLTIATTNFYDRLPMSLRRSGRMDKHISFPMPDSSSREEILKLYANNNEALVEIDFKTLAKKTVGFSCADLKTLINETLLTMVSENKSTVTNKDINRIVPLIAFKGIRQATKKEPTDRVCYHEIGHFICHYGLTKEPSAISVEKIGDVEGFARPFAMRTYKEENYKTTEELRNMAITSLGGYAAEQLFTGQVSTGVYSDLQNFGNTILRMSSCGMLTHNDIFNSQPRNEFMPFEVKDSNLKPKDPRNEFFDEYLNVAFDLINSHKSLALFMFNKIKLNKSLDAEEVQAYIDEFEKQVHQSC